MPKKPPSNGYYYFMLELQQKQGRKFKSMKEVAEEAAPFWARMTPQQKKVYNDIAKAQKQNQAKQTSIGENIDTVLKMEAEKENWIQEMKKDIENTISRAVKNGTIADQYFYVMHVNFFCKCNGRYYPAEIAIGRFNLREGIKQDEIYHSIILPGTLPLGYSKTAKVHSEETHQLAPPGPDAENNMEEVFTSLISFISNHNSESASVPAFYVYNDDQIEIAENVLEFMCAFYGSNIIFKIYSLQYFFFILRNSISKLSQKVWPTVSVSKLQLDRDVYDFCNGIACDFHENSDTPVYCSRSCIIRWVYTICDNCIKDLEIEPIFGQHVPLNASCTIPKRSNSRSSVTSVSLSETQSLYETPAGTFCPSRSESRLSSVSDASTLIDDSDITSCKGFDTDSQIDEDEEWQMPKHRGKQKLTSSTVSSQQQSQTLSDDFRSLSMSQNSCDSDYIPKRRPVAMSGVLQGASGLNFGLGPFVGRGRGRGIINDPKQD